MKKLILIIAVLLFSITSQAQFNKWSVSGEYGIHLVSDESSTLGNEFSNFGLGVRYNFSPTVGVGLTGAYNDIDLIDFDGKDVNLDFTRFNLEAYVNAFDILDLENDHVTLLFHGGPGLSILNTNNDYNTAGVNLRGGATLLYKLNSKLALTADFSTTGNLKQPRTLDGSYPATITGINSLVSTASVGLTFYLDKKEKEHADWYQKPDVAPIINETKVVNEYVTNNPVINFTQEEFNEYYETYLTLNPQSQFVFFDHDKFDIRETELNAIYKVYTQLEKNETWTLVIKGFASPTSSSDEYNQKLSDNRSKELFQKFVDMGIDESRISFEAYGKDKARSSENVFDVARRVELIVKK